MDIHEIIHKYRAKTIICISKIVLQAIFENFSLIVLIKNASCYVQKLGLSSTVELYGPALKMRL